MYSLGLVFGFLAFASCEQIGQLCQASKENTEIHAHKVLSRLLMVLSPTSGIVRSASSTFDNTGVNFFAEAAGSRGHPLGFASLQHALPDSVSKRGRLQILSGLRGGGRKDYNDMIDITDPGLQQTMLNEARGSWKEMMSVYDSLIQVLEVQPDNIPLKVAVADALVSAMRIAGNGNALTCHFKKGLGGGDKPEIRTVDSRANCREDPLSEPEQVRKIWGAWAPVAKKLLADVEKSLGEEEFCKQDKLCLLKLEATMYVVSSKGVITAALSGNAKSFLNCLQKLESLHPGFDNSRCYIFRGIYLFGAPWPVFDLEKANLCFEQAVQHSPHSKRNQYFAGLGKFALGNFQAARESMERVLQEKSSTPSELDCCEFYEAEARRTIEMIEERGY